MLKLVALNAAYSSSSRSLIFTERTFNFVRPRGKIGSAVHMGRHAAYGSRFGEFGDRLSAPFSFDMGWPVSLARTRHFASCHPSERARERSELVLTELQ